MSRTYQAEFFFFSIECYEEFDIQQSFIRVCFHNIKKLLARNYLQSFLSLSTFGDVEMELLMLFHTNT